jgi:chromatin segregation and condensation protein Rec8/ScpA/Scc1 (kleisin family)
MCHDYVNQSHLVDIEGVGEFAAIAASLALAKSQQLTPWLELVLPESDVEFDGADDVRPSICTFDEVVQTLARRLAGQLESVPRAAYVEALPKDIVAVPLASALLAQALDAQLTAESARGGSRVPPPIFLRIEMATRALRQSLRRLSEVSFMAEIRERRLDRRAAVVYFLALLDLARTGSIQIRQAHPFQDIVLLPGEVSVKREAG